MIKRKKIYSFTRRIAIGFVLILTGLILYVSIVNRHSKNMTIRQKILKAFYPAMMWLTKAAGTNQTIISNKTAAPVVPFYSLRAKLNDGSLLKLEDYKGKKILLVNTASDCGYTGQYAGLEQLYQEHLEKLVVIGIPANDFKEQEKGSDEAIASFCKINYGVSFPLLQKATVIRGSGQHEIFQWLTNKNKNGWNEQAPTWNFCKFLVDEQGKLTHFFAPSVEPLSTEMLQAIAE